MRPSEFEVVRPHLERAVDDVRYFLNGEKENEKAREESSELYDLMEANKTPPEVKGQGRSELTPEHYAALEWRSAGGEPITFEQREAILTGVLPGQSMSDEGWAAHERAWRGGWRESSRQVAVWLRKVGETVAADGIDWALSELPGEARDAAERSRHRAATRTAAEYVLTILTNCLASGGAGEHQASGGDEESDNAGAVPESRFGFLGGEELADALGVHPSRRDAFFQQLLRKRKSLGDDCWHQVTDPQPNSPWFLYRADSPALQRLAASYKTPKPA